MTERDMFEKALKEDPFDEATRKIYADWLDDHDEPELANHHRSWTKEKWQGAYD